MEPMEIAWLIKDFIIMVINVTFACVYEVYKLVVPPPKKQIRDQLILVTGAGGSLGREMALQLCDAGARLVLTDINESELQKTGSAVEERGGEVHMYLCDVSKRSSVSDMAKKVQQKVGPPSMVILSAGLYKHKPFLDHTPEDITSIVDVNLMGTMWVTQEFLPAMVSSNSGHLVLVSSVLGVMGRSQLAPYCASKFAITGFADALSQELKETADGVALTIVHPFVIGNITDVTVDIRVPGLFEVLSSKEAATRIIEGVRRGHEELYLPARLKPLMRINRALPRQVRRICQKFVEKPRSSEL